MKKVVFGILVFFLSVQIALAQSPFGEAPQNPENPGMATDPGTGTTPGVATGPGLGGAVSPNQAAGSPGSTPTNQNTGSSTSVTGSGLLPAAQNAGGAQYAGSALNAGTGANLSFWQYLLSLFNNGALNGKNFQTTDKNQETKVTSGGQSDVVLQFQNQWSAPTPVKTISRAGGSNFLNCGFSQSNKTLGGYIGMATCFMFYLIPVIIALLVLWFMFGSIKYINDSEHEERGQYKIFLTWGVIILFVALSFVGILRVMTKTLGL